MNTPSTKDPSTPDPDNLDPLQAFYHLFTRDQHSYESEEEYQERLLARQVFVDTLAQQDITPAQYLQLLQERYGVQ